MAKQTFTTGQVLTAAQVTALQANDYNQTVTTQTTNYVLVTADVGTRVYMNAAGATTITVNTGIFAAGDTLWLGNIGAGSCVVTAGTATVSKFSTASLTLSQYQGAYLYFTSTGVAILYSDSAGASTPLTTKGDLFGFSTLNARIPIGTNNQVLTADSAEALGLKWATAAGGGSMTALGSPLTLSGTPTISGIDQTYKDLYFLCFGFTNGATGDTVFIPNSNQLDVDFVITANSNNAAATEVKTADNIQFNLTANRQVAASAVNFFALTIKDYASTTNRKVWNLSGTYTAASGRVNYQAQGSINVNTAISSMLIAHSVSGFNGGTVELYGVN